MNRKEREARGLTARTWIVDADQAATIAAMADELGVDHSRFVRFLLKKSLEEIAAGRLQVRTRPIRYELIHDE